MAHKIKALAVSIGATLVFASFASHAEITLLKQDPQAGDPLSRLNFTVGGSIRPQFNMMSGDGDKDPISVTVSTVAPVSASRRITTCSMILAGLATTNWG